MEATCNCNNIKVQLQNRINIEDLDLTDLEASHEFFSKALHKVKSGGCQETQPCLIKSQIIGSWNVRQCLVCNIYTHAISYLNGDVICRSELNDKLHNVAESSNFSKVFRILLPTNLTYDDKIDIESSNYSIAEQESLLTIKKQATAVIEKMSQKMESNIETFMSKQRQILSELQSKAELDTNILSQLFINAKRKLETIPEVGSDENKQGITYGASSLDSETALNSFTVPITEEELQPTYDDHLYQLFPPEEIPLPSKDATGIFEMDGFTFSTSDKEKHEDSPEQSDKEMPYNPPSSANASKAMDIARSAPVKVPAWGLLNLEQKPAPIDKSPADIKEIAESIQNLAKSVRAGKSSTDVFGELPPPRKPKDN